MIPGNPLVMLNAVGVITLLLLLAFLCWALWLGFMHVILTAKSVLAWVLRKFGLLRTAKVVERITPVSEGATNALDLREAILAEKKRRQTVVKNWYR